MIVRNALHSRIEYDAYRTDMETLQLGPRDSSTTFKVDEAQRKFQNHKEKFERLRADVSIKLKFLEENKVCVHECLCWALSFRLENNLGLTLWYDGYPLEICVEYVSALRGFDQSLQKIAVIL